jgi:hypothetical protein
VLAEGLLAAAPLAGDKVVAAVTAGAREAARRGPRVCWPRFGSAKAGSVVGRGRSGRADGRAEDGEQAEAADDDGPAAMASRRVMRCGHMI